ncbi:MAG: alanine racemase [Lachnospiraceae bacterium]|nr:alanine racemase [Lachnospiraceae bacterium]
MIDYGRCAAYIDLDALMSNMSEIRRLIRPETKVIAVIKANAYGHGASVFAKELEKLDYLWGFAVAAVSEAAQLRDEGISKPILLLGASFEPEFRQLIELDVRPAVFSYDTALKLSNEAAALNRTVNIHIKTDTGMSRIGYRPGPDSIDSILKISKLPCLKIEGIFTHFSKADEKDLSYAKQQLETFKKIIKDLEDAGLSIPLKHCSNSAGIIALPEANMDLVRAGIIIYGLLPSEEMDVSGIRLKKVMNLKSRIVHIKTMEEGARVSYGGTYITKSGDILATVSFGYADGYPRTLSNKGYVLVRGRKAPIVGRICMDQFMINVRDIPDVCINDEVTLVGCDSGYEITMEELGDLSGRFNYEFACDISPRVPRIYLVGGNNR